MFTSLWTIEISTGAGPYVTSSQKDATKTTLFTTLFTDFLLPKLTLFAPLKIGLPKRKSSCPNHQFSRQLLAYWELTWHPIQRYFLKMIFPFPKVGCVIVPWRVVSGRVLHVLLLHSLHHDVDYIYGHHIPWIYHFCNTTHAGSTLSLDATHLTRYSEDHLKKLVSGSWPWWSCSSP